MAFNTAASQKKNEKSRQDLLQLVLAEALREEDNKYCADCEAKGPRWASWNLGVFLCIRCAGHHRNLGVHISRVRSVNLDSWTEDQVSILQQMGNRRARLIYESLLPENFRRPQTDYALEQFVRAKYEQRRYVDRSIAWEPPKPRKLQLPPSAIEDHPPKRSATANTGGLKLLPPMPGSSKEHGKQHQRTPSASSLSPPPPPAAAKAVSGDQKDLFDLFEPAAETKPNADITAGMSSVHLSPPAEQEQKTSGLIQHSATQSALDDLGFLGQTEAEQSSHPQQHQQRSVSNYNLMSMGGSQPASSGAAPVPAGSGSGLDDILSLYKQTPNQAFGTANYQMFQAPSLSGHQRNFSDAPAHTGGFAQQPPVFGQQAPMAGGFGGGFPQHPPNQMHQNSLQGFQAAPSNNFFQGSFQTPNQPAPAAAPAPAATTSSASSNAFDAIWQ